MKKPWDTWVLKGLSINEAAPLFEKMERMQMEPWGHAFGWKHLTLADGRKVKLTIQKNGVVPVYVAIAGAAIRKVFTSLFSGLFYTSNPITPVVDGEYSRIDPHDWEKGTYGPWQTSAQMATLFEYGTGESFYYKKGSMYSGRMRDVVQLLIGVDADIDDGKAGSIPYNYNWDDCHGIFVNQITNQWWVIWIDAAEGISAWPLVYNRIFTNEEKSNWDIEIPGVPESIPIYPRGSNADFREIMSQVDLADAYTDGAPLYPEHGWAFSYDGREAQAITITYSDEWKVANRWKLTISADGNGDPLSATLELQEQKCLYGEEDSAPKYPQEAQGSILSYDIAYPVVNPQPFGNDAPVDVFYRRGASNTPIIVRYGSYGDTDYAETGGISWPPAASAYLCGDTFVPADTSTGGSYVAEKRKTTKTTQIHYEIEGVDSPLEPEQNYAKEIPRTYDLSWEQDGNWNLVAISGGGAYAASTHHKATLIRKYHDTEQNFYATAFFKPFYEREAFCLYEKQQTTYATGPEDTIYTGGATGDLYTDVLNSAGQFDICTNVPFRQVPSPLCSTSYPHSSLGTTVLTGAIAASVALSDPVISANLAGDVCEPGGDPIQYQVWCLDADAVTYPGPGCAFAGTVDGSTETTRARQIVWIYNPRIGVFDKTWEVAEYDSLDPYTTYIDNPTLGAQLFLTYFDVFSGEGMSFARMNYGNTADLYYRGTLTSNYDLDFGAPGFGTGWFGIP